MQYVRRSNTHLADFRTRFLRLNNAVNNKYSVVSTEFCNKAILKGLGMKLCKRTTEDFHSNKKIEKKTEAVSPTKN